MPPAATRDRLIGTAVTLIRRRGYAAMSVEALCAEAGVTKGAFFHHFKSKQDLAVAAAGAFDAGADGLFTQAAFQAMEDPVERLLGYLALRRAMIEGPIEAFTCLLGTLVQEVHAEHPALREAAQEGLARHVDMLAGMIRAAEAASGRPQPFGATSLARHIQAVLQGAFILAKAGQDPHIVRGCLDELAHDIAARFGRPPASPLTSPE